MLYDTIYEEVRDKGKELSPSSAKQERYRLRKAINTVLDGYIECKLIHGYTKQKDGVTIVLPEPGKKKKTTTQK